LRCTCLVDIMSCRIASTSASDRLAPTSSRSSTVVDDIQMDTCSPAVSCEAGQGLEQGWGLGSRVREQG